MTLCLIDLNHTQSKKLGLFKPISCQKAFTLTEMMISIAFTSLLMMVAMSFYNVARIDYASGVSGANLQTGADIVLDKIIHGESESGTTYRLSTAYSYLIPNGVGSSLYTCGGSQRATPCNTGNPFGELYFCQDSPCTPSDSTARWYYLNSTGTSVIYHHPSGGGTVEETIYTAPNGSTLTLRFSPAAVGVPANVVEIDVDLTKTLAANVTNARMATSGDVSTFVLLRNHP